MAFALKVKAVQRRISECPYMADTGEASSANEPVGSAEDSYSHVANEMEEEVRNTDLKGVAPAIGADFEVVDGVQCIRLALLNRPCELRKEGLFEGGEQCRDSWVKMIVYDYVRRKGGAPVTGDWVAFDHFPRTPSHIKAFQKTAEDELASAFDQDRASFEARLVQQGSTQEHGQIRADYSCRLDLLPRIPLLLRFWAADDEFPASCKLFVDSSANQYLDMEFLGHLVEKFVKGVTR